MKISRLLAAMAMTGTLLLASQIQWVHSLAKARSLAKAEGKNLMVFVEAKHCGYCRKMKREVFSTPEAAYALRRYVPVMLDISSGEVKKAFPQAAVTPTIYFVTPDLKPLQEIVGYQNEEFFYWRLDDADKEAAKLRKDD